MTTRKPRCEGCESRTSVEVRPNGMTLCPRCTERLATLASTPRGRAILAVWTHLYDSVGYFAGYRIPDDEEASAALDGGISVAEIVDLAIAAARREEFDETWPCLTCGEPIRVNALALLGENRYLHCDHDRLGDHVALRGS